MRIFYFFTLLFLITSCVQESQGDPDQETDSTTSEVSNDLDHFYPILPVEVELFDVDVKINNFDVKERLDKEIIVNTYYHSSTVQILKRANRYFPMIEKILKEEGMPDDMKYLCVIESALRQATSPTGAKGFWQFMPATAKEYGMKINDEIDERLDVEKSTHAACEYMKDANRKFDNWIMSAASYNCGVGGLRSYVKAQGVNDFFQLHLNNETSRYVFRIMALKLLMENPEEYGFFPSEMELYDPIDIRHVKVNESISNLAAWAIDNGSNLHMLKVLNPWLIGNSLTISGSESYTLALLKSE